MVNGAILPAHVAQITAEIKTSKSVKLLHINARSIRSKSDDIMTFIYSCNMVFNVVMFSETWYDDDTEHLVMPGYNHFLNRKESRGGGVALQTNFSRFQLVHDYAVATEDYEILCIRKDSQMFGVIYRPPHDSICGFLGFFDKLPSFASNNAYSLTIGGDLNIDVLKDSAPAVDLLLTLQCNGFRNEITTPTRVTTTSTSLLDLFITNTVAENVISRVIISALSDHLPVMLILEQQSTLKK